MKQNKRNMRKTVYITATHRGNKRVYSGTVDYLVDKVFGYTLECGYSWNERIKENPKTAQSLVKALNLSTTEEIAAYKAKCDNEKLDSVLIS